MFIEACYKLEFHMCKDGFSGFTSLEELTIRVCPKLMPSLVNKDEINDCMNGRWLLPHSLGKLTITHFPEGLQLYFPGNLTPLKRLNVWSCPGLVSLKLHSCTALEELTIHDCGSLETLEGFQSVGGLRDLEVLRCPSLPPYLARLLNQGYELCPQLERLQIDESFFLTTSFCKNLTSLERLEVCYVKAMELRESPFQDIALQLLTSLQELRFLSCYGLPVVLHSLPSLERLEIDSCWRVSRLPEKGLRPSLEELDVLRCSKELTEQCQALATAKLRVRIDGKYVK